MILYGWVGGKLERCEILTANVMMSEGASEACLRGCDCHSICVILCLPRTCDLFGVYSDITKLSEHSVLFTANFLLHEAV